MKETRSEAAQHFDIPELERFIKEPEDCVRRYMRLIVRNPLSNTETGSIINDAVSSSGKMIRSKLLLLCGTLGPLWEAKKERLCALAALVELTHLASLIHDDIVDDAPYRRGKPAIHSKYGRNAAVYAGDLLIASVYHYQAAEQLNESGAALSKAIERMCAGEIGQDACRYKEEVTIEEYLHNVKGKTAALFQVACRIGAREAGCCDALVSTLERFGENIGFMLQLRDDLLDFTADGKVFDKEIHRDFLSGIYTMPLLKALEHPDAQKLLRPVMRENTRRRLSSEEISDMEKNVIRLGGIDGTRAEIKTLAKKNEKLLNTIEDNALTVTLMKKLTKLLEV
ncbi:polyprenyl synthetase family protein [Treponema sp. OMZ 805]|uniref:polyprenyl synthetase family protein n=1 Tax=Treponema sp. OMZ 805 TaxID=2726068 RepID=UPI003D90458B